MLKKPVSILALAFALIGGISSVSAQPLNHQQDDKMQSDKMAGDKMTGKKHKKHKKHKKSHGKMSGDKMKHN